MDEVQLRFTLEAELEALRATKEMIRHNITIFERSMAISRREKLHYIDSYLGDDRDIYIDHFEQEVLHYQARIRECQAEIDNINREERRIRRDLQR